LCFIGGIMQHIRGMSAILNPIVNSYKRLVPGYEAPVYISWGEENRSPLIRIPYADTEPERRVELRSPDPAANPYLALAVCLMAGLDGIRKKTAPPSPVTGNIYRLSPEERKKAGIGMLPGNLKEALDELESDDFIRGVIGPHIYEKYTADKRHEWEEYSAVVTEWEIERCLNRI
ncbi:MAG: type I glutamate--ammonia ligase, partial [Lachnospiraceae bacterium]|nr:type I glutamate--ammonia ligase [Lachnospiraceae bacterium]